MPRARVGAVGMPTPCLLQQWVCQGLGAGRPALPVHQCLFCFRRVRGWSLGPRHTRRHSALSCARPLGPFVQVLGEVG